MRIDPETGLKVCPRCKDKIPEGKPPEDFKRDQARVDGLYPYCRECERGYSRTYIKTEKAKDTRSAWLKSHLEVAMFYNSRDRATKNSLPFAISKTDISIPETCPICHCPLVSGDGKNRSDSPSLDKWSPALGYVPGNIWVICLRCNLRKGDLSGDELLTFAYQLIDARKEYNAA